MCYTETYSEVSVSSAPDQQWINIKTGSYCGARPKKFELMKLDDGNHWFRRRQFHISTRIARSLPKSMKDLININTDHSIPQINGMQCISMVKSSF